MHRGTSQAGFCARRGILRGLAAAWPALAAGSSRAAWARASAAPLDVTRFGAVGDGKTSATRAIQKAIDVCAAAGGGTVVVPAGRFLCGALHLRTNLELRLGPGAVLVASQRFDDFPAMDGRWEGVERKTYSSLLNGVNLENVAITGPGLLDGQGWPWWAAHEATKKLRLERNLPREAENPPGAPLRWPRPRLLNLIRCQNVRVEGIVAREAPSYTFHFVYCQDVVVNGVTLLGLETQNSDGLVIDSCKQVRISGCSIASGGESISLKSGYNEDGRRVGLATEDVVVTNCNLQQSHGAGIAVGSETAAGVRNVLVSNCTIASARYAVHIRSPRGRGGVVQGLRLTNLTCNKIREAAIMVSHFFDSIRMDGLWGEGESAPGNPETDRTLLRPVDESTPAFRDIDFTGLTLGEVGEIAVMEGLPERYIHNIQLRDLRATAAKSGIVLRRVAGVVIDNVTLPPLPQAALAARDVQNLEIHRLRTPPDRRRPAIELENVDRALIHGCQAASPADLLHLRGTRNRQISLTANAYPPAAPPR